MALTMALVTNWWHLELDLDRGSGDPPTAVCAVDGRGAALVAAARWVIVPNRCKPVWPTGGTCCHAV